jgi:hypothetical protein
VHKKKNVPSSFMVRIIEEINNNLLDVDAI